MSALTPAHSHWIQSHGYSNGVMTLITKTGEAYAANIPESRYSEFLKAPSQGSFFNLYIKPFATVTKVDVAEAVALVEKAKVKVAGDGLRAAMATPSTVTVPKAGRKTPAKSLLPHEPHEAGKSGYVWIDFRCIADPTTGPDLVKSLKVFLDGKDIRPEWVPIGWVSEASKTQISGMGGCGYVNQKYLKKYLYTGQKSSVLTAMAKAYRSAYRSWVRRNEARAAKVREANLKAIEAAAKEVFAGGWTGKTVEQARAERAEAVLKALEGGMYSVTVGIVGTNLGVAGYSFTQKRN